MDRIKIKSSDLSGGVVVIQGRDPRDAVTRFLKIYCRKYQIPKEAILNG